MAPAVEVDEARFRGVWESLLEINPQLGSGKLVLRRTGEQSFDPNAYEVQLRQPSDGGYSLLVVKPLERETRATIAAVAEENATSSDAGLSAHATSASSTAAPQSSGVCSASPSSPSSPSSSSSSSCPPHNREELWIDFGAEDLKVQESSLRYYQDCLTLGIVPKHFGSWRQKHLPLGKLEEALELSELCCRRCRASLLQPLTKPRGVFMMPSPMWQACADTMACEECAPLGLQHLAAKPGQLFVSSQCLIVSGADVLPTSIRRGAASEGLLRCAACQFVLGETSAESTVAPSRTSKSKRKSMLFCEEWGQRAGCKREGFALYKHRVELAIPTTDAEVGNSSPAVVSPSPLTGVTEVAAVAAQLLALRSSAGMSRFLVCAGPPVDVMTSPPDAQVSPRDEPGANDEQQVVELRIIVPELLIMGPNRERSTAQQNQQDGLRSCSNAASTVYRVTKVAYRQRARRPEDATSSEWLTLTIPPEALEEVIENLRHWMRVLPISYSLSPFSSKDGLGTWCCSCLTLPSLDSSNCTE